MAASARIVQSPGSQLPRQSTTFPPGNPYTPPIPQPAEDLPNLTACVSALKASVESLSGQRGDATNRAVTFNDLVSYGVLTPTDVNSPSGGSISEEEDLDTSGLAPIDSPAFTGTPTAPTPGTVTRTGEQSLIATIAWVEDWVDIEISTLAPLVSPVFLGNPQAPTPAPGDNDTSIATTGFVVARDIFLQDQIDDIAGGGGVGTITGVSAGTGLTGGGTAGGVTLALVIPVAIAHGGTNATTPGAALANLGGAPLNSPVFTGDPRAPTPLSTDIDNSIATTAWVVAAVGADELIDGGNF